MADGDDESSCALLGPLAILLQGGLAAAALATLIVKRQTEHPRRTVRIWFFDTSKQAFGQAAFHALNIGLAVALGWWDSGSTSGGGDACVWYFLNTMLDSTVGLVALAVLVWLVDRLVRHKQWRQLYSGEYGRPPRVATWAKQVCLFVGIVLVVKVATTALLLVPFLEPAAAWMLGPITGNATLELVIVMVLTPLVMDVFSFWVMDQVLKHSAGAPEPRRRFSTITGETEEEAEALLMNDVYGIDDDL